MSSSGPIKLSASCSKLVNLGQLSAQKLPSKQSILGESMHFTPDLNRNSASLTGLAKTLNVKSTIRRKIKIARWLTNKVAEYDISNDFWSMQKAEIAQPFNAFSASVFLPSQDIAVIGGLDDTIPNKPAFTNKCMLIQEMPVDSYQNRYIEKQLPSMITKRGCMTAVFHEGYIYCFGGINYTDKVMKKCERLCVLDEAKDQW